MKHKCPSCNDPTVYMDRKSVDNINYMYRLRCLTCNIATKWYPHTEECYKEWDAMLGYDDSVLIHKMDQLNDIINELNNLKDKNVYKAMNLLTNYKLELDRKYEEIVGRSYLDE